MEAGPRGADGPARRRATLPTTNNTSVEMASSTWCYAPPSIYYKVANSVRIVFDLVNRTPSSWACDVDCLTSRILWVCWPVEYDCQSTLVESTVMKDRCTYAPCSLRCRPQRCPSELSLIELVKRDVRTIAEVSNRLSATCEC